jgi:ribulose-5-phosphate 4-epimerase/fuculose-1-phosphate aldolase
MDEWDKLCVSGDRFHQRGLAFGATGNLSVRNADRIWITPTGRPLGGLTTEDLAEIDLEGRPLAGPAPSKEWPFHAAVYRHRPDLHAVVHLHATWSVALSCLATLDEQEPLPPLTPYYVMRVAPLGVVPYFKPGSTELASAIAEAITSHNCLLLRHHGFVAAGRTVSEAVDCAEELEETARLWFILRGETVSQLSPTDVAALASFRRA